MKIVLVSQQYPPDTARGGIGTQTSNKARALALAGHEVHVLACAAGPEAADEVTHDGIQVHRLVSPGAEPGREFPIFDEATYQVGYSFALLAELNRLILELGPDVVDFPEYGGEGFAYLIDRRRANWAPVTVQLHGPLELLAERIGWPRPGSVFHSVGTFLERMSVTLADGLTACSATIAEFAADRYGVERESIEIVYSGVDLDAFQPSNGDRPQNGRPTVLFVGNVSRSKGVEILLQAVLRLRHKYPSLLLRVAGESNGLSQELYSRARAAGGGNCLDLLGFVDHDRLAGLYREADVCCAPAQFEAGVASVYCEAMASGCPLVASTAGGGPEAVLDGVTGLLVPPVDVQAVASALDRILDNHELALRMGQAGRRRAEEMFGLGQLAGRLATAYEHSIDHSSHKLKELDG